MSLALPTAKTEGHFVTWQLVDNIDGLLTGGEIQIACGTVMPINLKRLAKTYLKEFILLRDADGVFSVVESHVQESLKSGPGSESGEGEPETVAEIAAEIETLQPALAEAQSQNEALTSKSRYLQDNVKRAKERVKEMWNMNCAQLAG